MADATKIIIENAAQHQHIPSSRWLVLTLVGFVALSNHYARDVLGTLEHQIESELGITASQYNALNSVFFAPNIVVPPIAGILCHKFGASVTIVVFSAIASIGHMIFAFAITQNNFLWLMIGRGMVGVSYEALDMLPLPLLQPLFGEEWAFVMGATISFENLGSVLAFLLSPLIYQSNGVMPALVFGCLVGMTCLPASVIAWRIDEAVHHKIQTQQQQQHDLEADCDADHRAESDSDTPSGEHSDDNTDDSHSGHHIHLHHYTSRCSIERDMIVVTISPNKDDPPPAITVASETAATSPPVSPPCSPTPSTNLPHNMVLTTTKPSLSSSLAPLKVLLQSTSFWLFTLAGSLTMAAVLPFLLVGAKHFQIKFGISVMDADVLMMLPSVSLMVMCPLVGAATDALQLTWDVQLRVLWSLLVLCPVGLIVIAESSSSMLVPVLLIRYAYTFHKHSKYCSFSLFLLSFASVQCVMDHVQHAILVKQCVHIP
eukprot:c292_g1_i1.p1 GENE.c292_g1_i1~~c292_g1_i1.p1  ORF type:complete len:487 (+),score=130.65 c292_g1_i1:311-1771(+)